MLGIFFLDFIVEFEYGWVFKVLYLRFGFGVVLLGGIVNYCEFIKGGI